MKPFHIKRGQEVVIITGPHKEKRGKILELLPKKERVVVEGVNLTKKAVRKSQNHPEGGFVEREGSVHISNVMLAERYDARRAKKQSAAPVSSSKKTKVKA